MTDEGATGLPNGAEENFRWGDSWEPPSFLQGKVGYRIAPSSDPASPAHLPPEGKALDVGASLQSIQSFRPIDSPGRARLAEFPRPQAGKENPIMF